MEEYRLDFASFIYHDNGVFELIVDEGTKIEEQHVNQLFELIKSIEPKPENFLVNRKNSYSISFKASIMLSRTKLAKNLAIIKYGKLPWPLKGFFSPKFYHMAFFDDRESALNWLHLKQDIDEASNY